MKKGKKYIIAFIFSLTLFAAYGVSSAAYAASIYAPDFSVDRFLDMLKEISWSDPVPLSIVIPMIGIITFLFILLSIFSGKAKRSASRGGGAYSSQIVQSLNDPIIGLNKSGNITFVNLATLALFEAKEQDLLGKKLVITSYSIHYTKLYDDCRRDEHTQGRWGAAIHIQQLQAGVNSNG